MQLISVIALASAVYATDQQDCRSMKGGADNVAAIQGLCSKTDMVVPSNYAANGHKVGKQLAYITGTSLSPQPHICVAFHERSPC